MDNPVKVAILSCNHGHASGYYFGFQKDPRFELVAVSIAKGYEKLVPIEKLKGVKIYYDDEQLLDKNPQIEAVVLASANWLHFKQFKLCFERNLHVLSMKVPTLDLSEYDKIIEMKNKSKSICCVELEMRYAAEVMRLKDLMQSGKIGKIQSFYAQNTSHNPLFLPWHGIAEESYGRKVHLKPGDERYRGGALTDHPHIFDILRWILEDEVDELYATTAPNFRKNVEVEDFVFVMGKMKNGTTFSLDPSYSRGVNYRDEYKPGFLPGYEQYPKRVEVNMSVFGDKGYIIGDVYNNWIHNTGLPDHNYISRRCGLHEGQKGGRLDDFYMAVRGIKPPTITLEEHRKTIEIIDAAYRSIYEGKPIKL